MSEPRPRLTRLRSAVLVVLAVFVAGVVFVNLRDRSDSPSGGESPDAAPARVEVPAAPDGTPEIGTYVLSEVAESGEVAVRTWIRSEAPVERLELTTADPDSLPGTVEASRVVVRAADGTRLALRSSVGTQTQRVRLREPATELYVSYTIAGDTLASQAPTVAGRILARVTAMDVVFAGESGPTVRQVQGPGVVLNAACLAPDAGFETAPEPCGAATDDGGWQVQLRGLQRHARVIAQLGEPVPSAPAGS